MYAREPNPKFLHTDAAVSVWALLHPVGMHLFSLKLG